MKPIVVTCGEPAGIGPEVAARAWAALADRVPLVWLGDARHLPEGTPHQVISDASEAAEISANRLPVLHHPFAGAATAGQPDPANAQGVIDVIARAVDLVTSGQASAICTAPIHKKALKDGAGFAYPGHTEYLAALAGDCDVVMMLASDQLRVVPATIHIALADVPTALTPALLRRTVEITHTSLQTQFGISAPRIAIAGLNPHAGEGGAMGQEELLWINQLVLDMQAESYTLRGPLPADTMFHAAARAQYDAAIAMYHDLSLIHI